MSNRISEPTGAIKFIQLTDVPNSYTGKAGEVVVVNSTETGLIFTPISIGLTVGTTPILSGTDGYILSQSGGKLAEINPTTLTPSSRTLTINGTTYDLTADRSWSVGTVDSVSNSDGTLTISPTTGAVVASLKRTPVSVTYASTITPTISGALSIQRIIATGDLTINIPTGGTDGANLELWITASGGDRQLTLKAGIKIPTSSVFTSPQTISSGKKAKLLLQYDATLNGGQWELTSFVNGY